MNNIHQRLMEKNGLYAKWHRQPGYQVIQWLALLVVAIIIGRLLISRTEQQPLVSYGNSSFAHSLINQQDVDKLKGLNNALLSLHNQLLHSSPSAQGSIRSKANTIITQRAKALESLIKTDPQEALSLAFDQNLINNLSVSFPQGATSLEQQGQWSGTIGHWHSDDFKNKTSHDWLTLTTKDNQSLEVDAPQALLPNPKPNQVFSISGIKVNSTIAATDVINTGATTNTITTSTCCSTLGAQNILAILVNFPNSVPNPYPPLAAAQQAYFGTTTPSLNTYWLEASYGQTWATGVVAGPYTLSQNYTCSFDSSTGPLVLEALNQAAASGINVSTYSRLSIVVPDMGCGWSGATAGNNDTIPYNGGTFTGSLNFIDRGNWAGVNGYDIQGATQVLAHEFGHNLGLNHSRSRAFGAEALGSLGTQGNTIQEYGDGFTAMTNGGLGQYDAPHKAQILNWFKSGNIQNVTQNGTFNVNPLETYSTGPQALKIQRGTGNAGYYLWVEYRQPIGYYDSWLSGANSFGKCDNVSNSFGGDWCSGAMIHYEDAITDFVQGSNNTLTSGYSDLLDFSPNDTWGVYEPTLHVGQTWTDPYTDLSLTVNSTSTAGLSITAKYSGSVPCTHSNPSVSLSPANPSVAPGGTVNYTLSVTNTDSSSCSSNNYSLSSANPLGWSSSFSPNSITLNPGASATITMSKTAPLTATVATYQVDATAQTGAFSSTATANATVAIISCTGDCLAPTVTISSPLNNTTVSGRSVSIKALATDNVKVTKLQLYIDNLLITSTTKSSLSYSWSVSKVTVGSHTITVKALDAAGNIGSSSVTVTK